MFATRSHRILAGSNPVIPTLSCTGPLGVIAERFFVGHFEPDAGYATADAVDVRYSLTSHPCWFESCHPDRQCLEDFETCCSYEPTGD